MFSIVDTYTAQQDIKKSHFVAVAAPVCSVEQAQDFLTATQDTSTTHQCWAWKINGQSRINDDGEPSGTAGRPILAVIEGHQLDNIIVLVNRWYGGVKLGTGGLMRAYSSTAQLCLQSAIKIPIIKTVAAQFYSSFNYFASVQHYLAGLQLEPTHLQYDAHGVRVNIRLPEHLFKTVDEWLLQLSAGQQQLKVINQTPHAN